MRRPLTPRAPRLPRRRRVAILSMLGKGYSPAAVLGLVTSELRLQLARPSEKALTLAEWERQIARVVEQLFALWRRP